MALKFSQIRFSLIMALISAQLLMTARPSKAEAPSAMPPSAPVSGCRDDALNPYVKSLVTDMFSSGQPYEMNFRSHYGIPGALAPDVVQITTDSIVCLRYRDLHNATIPAGYSPSANVFVFYARGVYVVVDSVEGEHYMGWTFLNSTGRVLAQMAT